MTTYPASSPRTPKARAPFFWWRWATASNKEPSPATKKLTETVVRSRSAEIIHADRYYLLICCLLVLPRYGPGDPLRTQPSQTLVRFPELTHGPKECCGTSCACRKWRGSSRCPAPLPHLPTSSRRTRLSSASKSALQCSSICQFRRKCDGLPGPLPPILHR